MNQELSEFRQYTVPLLITGILILQSVFALAEPSNEKDIIIYDVENYIAVDNVCAWPKLQQWRVNQYCR